jgi:hypothetical protein
MPRNATLEGPTMISLAVNAALAFYGAVVLAGFAAPPPDPYTQALRFALAGNDRAVVHPLDWAACAFEVNGAVVRIGAADPARLTVALTETRTGWGPIRRVTVGLHGDATVYERFDPGLEAESPWDDEAARMLKREVMRRSPELFQEHRIAASDHVLTLATDDLDRVRQAWAVVLRGCTVPHGS